MSEGPAWGYFVCRRVARDGGKGGQVEDEAVGNVNTIRCAAGSGWEQVRTK